MFSEAKAKPKERISREQYIKQINLNPTSVERLNELDTKILRLWLCGGHKPRYVARKLDICESKVYLKLFGLDRFRTKSIYNVLFRQNTLLQRKVKNEII